MGQCKNWGNESMGDIYLENFFPSLLCKSIKYANDLCRCHTPTSDQRSCKHYNKFFCCAHNVQCSQKSYQFWYFKVPLFIVKNFIAQKQKNVSLVCNRCFDFWIVSVSIFFIVKNTTTWTKKFEWKLLKNWIWNF